VRCWRLDAPGLAGAGLAVLALGAAGCGNDRHDFRVEKLNPLVKRVSEQRTAFATTLRLSRPHLARHARVLRADVGRLGAAMRKVAALEPPPGTGAKFRRYTRANSALLSSLYRFVDAFASGTVAQQRRAEQAAAAALGTANRAQTDFEHALG
jgi:hypothetical protein